MVQRFLGEDDDDDDDDERKSVRKVLKREKKRQLWVSTGNERSEGKGEGGTREEEAFV